jgi:hypothetical protein
MPDIAIDATGMALHATPNAQEGVLGGIPGHGRLVDSVQVVSVGVHVSLELTQRPS